MQHLNAEDAVRLLRWRKNNSGESLSVGDVGRVEIQHTFLKAMAQQTLKLETLSKIPQLAAIMDKKLKSDLSYSEMLWFGEQTLKLDQEKIRFHSLPGDYTGTIWSPTYRNYQSYVFVNSASLLQLVNQYMNPYKQPITEDMQHIIHGTNVESTPSLPVSTGLPIVQQPAENEVELPAGSSLTVAPLPVNTDRPSNAAQSAEDSMPQMPAVSLEPLEEEPPAAEEPEDESPDAPGPEETGQETVVEGPVVPEEEPAPEPEQSGPAEEPQETESM